MHLQSAPCVKFFIMTDDFNVFFVFIKHSTDPDHNGIKWYDSYRFHCIVKAWKLFWTLSNKQNLMKHEHLPIKRFWLWASFSKNGCLSAAAQHKQFVAGTTCHWTHKFCNSFKLVKQMRKSFTFLLWQHQKLHLSEDKQGQTSVFTTLELTQHFWHHRSILKVDAMLVRWWRPSFKLWFPTEASSSSFCHFKRPL